MNSTALALQGAGVDTTQVAIIGSTVTARAQEQPAYMAPANEANAKKQPANARDDAGVSDDDGCSSSEEGSDNREVNGEEQSDTCDNGEDEVRAGEDQENDEEEVGDDTSDSDDVDGEGHGTGDGSEGDSEEADPADAALLAAGLESDGAAADRGKVGDRRVRGSDNSARALGQRFPPLGSAGASGSRGSDAQARRGTIQAALLSAPARKGGSAGTATTSGVSSQSAQVAAGKKQKRVRKGTAGDQVVAQGGQPKKRSKNTNKTAGGDRGKAGVTRLAVAEKRMRS